MKYEEIEGNLISLAKEGMFNVIGHGCNCFCRQKRGIAPQMVEAFNTNNWVLYKLENPNRAGDINKLGQIEYISNYIEGIKDPNKTLAVVNCYTQYHWEGKRPLDYHALAICLRKINHLFTGKHIGMPMIGCGLAGGDWDIVKQSIQSILTDLDVTIVKLKQ